MSKNRGRPKGGPQTVFFLPGILSFAEANKQLAFVRVYNPHTPFHLSGRAKSNLGSLSKETGDGDGGAYRDRTDDLKLAKLPLSQLS